MAEQSKPFGECPELHPSAVRRFWKYVDIRELEPGDCWGWMASTQNGGYGQLMLTNGARTRKVVRAHRVSYAIHFGPPGEMLVRHDCDNPACSNPAHLRTGTHQDNCDDMVQRDRSTYGPRHYRSSFTESEVIRMREIRFDGARTDCLASVYGVNRARVSSICAGLSWQRTGGPITKRYARGEQIAFSKLTEGDVRAIRAQHANGVSKRALAKKYGVAWVNIHKIIRRESWRHVA